MEVLLGWGVRLCRYSKSTLKSFWMEKKRELRRCVVERRGWVK